jgi:hypothetical protein
MAKLLAKISSETYQKYVYHRRGQPLIYCRLNVALYGTLKAALLFCKKLTESLKMRGFKSILMIGVLPKKQSRADNAPSFGISMISRSCT